MAVNNSGKPPPNSLDSDDHFGLGELDRIRDQYYTEPASIRDAKVRGLEAQRYLSDLEEMERQIPGWMTLPANQKSFIKHSRTTESVDRRLNIYQGAKDERLNDQATNIIGRKFAPSAVNSYIARNSNSLEAQVAGMAMSGQGYASLDSQRKQITSQMHGLRQDSMSQAGNYISESGINNTAKSMLDADAGQMKGLAQQLIPITLAMQQLKQQGLDPKGRQEELARIGNKAAGTLHANNLQAEMQSGKGMGAFSMAELKKKEAEAAEKLIKAMDALKNSVGKTTDELTELNKEAEEAAEEYKKLNEAKGIKGKDGGGFDNYEKIKLIAGTFMEALNIGASTYQNATINQPMQMVANTTAAANMENEKYNSWHAAMAGNMHERMNLNWTTAGRFGESLASNQNALHNLRQGQAVAGIALGAAQGTEAVVKSGQGLVTGVQAAQSVAQAGLNIASGIGSGVTELTAQQRQTEMMATKIAGTMALKGSEKALTKIQGQQLQEYRDYAMGINETAGAMGGEVGEAFLNRTGGADFLDSLSAAGIGPKEFGALSQKGALQMGSRFNESQIFKAVDLERRGYGTAAQNMQRIGSLAATGQGDSAANLGKIIEEAMQRGLNSSKALDMIVENTAKISEGAMMAGAGADTQVGVAAAILQAVDTNNPNKEMAHAMAQAGYDRNEGARRNIATSLPGFLNVDRTMKDFGVDRTSAMIMAGLSSAETIALKGIEGEKEKAEWLEKRGVNTKNMDSSWFKGNALAGKLDENAAVQVLAGQDGLGYPLGDPGAFAAELRKYKNDQPVFNALVFGDDLSRLTPEQRELRKNQAASLRLSDPNTDPTVGMARAGVLSGGMTQKVSDKKLAELKLESRNNLTDENRLGRKAESARAAEGATLLGAEAKTAFAVIAQSGRDAFNKMTEQAWGTAAQKTAENFGTSANLMGEASGKLEKAAEAMTISTTSMALSATTLAGAVADAIAKIKDKLGMAENSHEPVSTPEEIETRKRAERRWSQKGGR